MQNANQDAARANYESTSVPSIGPPQKAPAHALPHTGYAVAWVLLAALVLAAAGVFLRGFVRKEPS